jgi:oligopeptide/dipeptide ABC transporter ATP-binding protein
MSSGSTEVTPVVRVPDLRVIVPGSHTIVDGVEFELHSGEVLGLVGESGSGKTTVALALLGYARKGMELQGSAFVDGIDVIAASDAVRQDLRGRIVSYVPQDPSASLNPALRIGSQLRDRLRAHDRAGLDPDQRIADVLERMHLPTSREFLRRYPHQLSGGQVQRVCIALAVLCRPKVIVLDEPTTGLDVMTQARVLELVSSVIVAENTAAVYVTHDLAVVAGLADRIAVMYSGLFMEEAEAETLLQEPLHPYTRRLVQSTPSLHARTALIGIGGSPLNPKDREDACPFAARCDYATEVCIEQLPALESLGGGHRVRCARVDELADAVTAAGTVVGNGVWGAHTAHDDSALLDVRTLCAFYGHNEVLHGVELSIREGECLALVGESGSGKTTLGRCISGLHVGRATGEIRFGGETIPLDPARRTKDVRRTIQYVFQSPYASLNPRHRIGKSIAMPLEIFGLGGERPRERVRELLRRVNLDPAYEARYPSQLSGGERQRVAIARALAAEPTVLVCDEITSALDVSTQASILELLGELRREMNLTILFITHHLPLVRAVADRAMIMRDGAVIEQGSAESLLDNPQDVYTRELISSTPVLG